MSASPKPSHPAIDISKAPEPELKSDPIASERYVSRDFMEREWERLWTRVWNVGGLEQEIPNPGDYITCELGTESLIFVRDAGNTVRGYYNVCQHRGNRLVHDERGRARHFYCTYHGWLWGTDGELLRAQDPEDFRRGNPCGKLRLAPVKVETWAGFIWFNLDPESEPLQAYLDPIGPQIDTYRMHDMVRTHHITLEADCNWKVIQDNFNESYHIPTVHPVLKYFLDDTYANTQFDLYPKGHNRMLMRGGGPSPRAADEEEMVLNFMGAELEYWGLERDAYRGRIFDMRADLQRQKRRLGREKGFDFSSYIDDQLTDHYHYTLFPNVSLSMKPDGCIFLRGTPHASDPQKCYFDCWYFTLFPEGVDEYFAMSMTDSVSRDAEVEHRTGKLGEVFMGGGVDQDASVFVSQQKGLASRGYRGVYLSHQERRIQWCHQVIDEYLAGER